MVDMEHNEQCKVVNHARLLAEGIHPDYPEQEYPELKWLHSIPNGGLRSRRQAGKLKAEGMTAGILDLFLPVARRGYHGLYIEMKRPDGKGRASTEQREFIKHCKKENYLAEIHKSADTAWQAILYYLNLKERTNNVFI